MKSMQEELAQLRARGAEVKTLESEIDQLRKRSARKSAMISKAYVSMHAYPTLYIYITHIHYMHLLFFFSYSLPLDMEK